MPMPSENGTMPIPREGGRGKLPGENPPEMTMDMAAAAEILGVTEEQLSEALEVMQEGFPDMAAVAEELGVSEEALREALGFPAGGPPESGRLQGGPSENMPSGGPGLAVPGE